MFKNNSTADRAWVTYLSDNSYLVGCLVLAYSLRKVKSRYPLVVMTPISPMLEDRDLEELRRTSNIILEPIDTSVWQLSRKHQSQTLCDTSSSDSINNSDSSSSSSSSEDGEKKTYLWDYFIHTWAKLAAWGLVRYKRLVLLDCDMLVRINMDQLLNENPRKNGRYTIEKGIDMAEEGEEEDEGEEKNKLNEKKLQLGHADAYLDLPPNWVAAAHACTCNPMHNPRYPASWTPESCAYSQFTGNPCPPSHNYIIQNGKEQEQQVADLQVSSSLPSPSSAASFLERRSYFNSGLVVLIPSLDQLKTIQTTFREIKCPSHYTFPDQDLLNEVFRGRWKSLGYGYNALKTLVFTHAPIWNEGLTIPALLDNNNLSTQNQQTMPVVNIHYILEKPWKVADLNKARIESNRFVEHYSWWWQAHDELLRDSALTG
ncbi:hypothetical protein BG011_003231 [Mortierella polycephala]|uniref:Nucleotide-diphospho-sugar transferase n=1 Tax=Mortierella polycephala TaxID=41804 RepID=A0A9P6U3V7_9FUNG|nr:hypothetical protein BG011_003231 [Mortierella polycephala]